MTDLPFRLEVVEKDTGKLTVVGRYSSPYLAERAREEFERDPDNENFRTRIVGPSPWA